MALRIPKAEVPAELREALVKQVGSMPEPIEVAFNNSETLIRKPVGSTTADPVISAANAQVVRISSFAGESSHSSSPVLADWWSPVRP